MAAANDARVVALSGDIDVYTAEAVRASLAQEITSGRPGPVVADMSAVTFIDSTGVSALVTSRDAASRAGRPFRLRNLAPGPMRVLEVLGLADLFDVDQVADPDAGSAAV